MSEYLCINSTTESLASTSIKPLNKQRDPQENQINGFEVTVLPLPDEIMCEIFNYISEPKDRCSVRETSKQFKRCLDSSYWGRCFSAFGLSDCALSCSLRAFFACESYSDSVKYSLSQAGIRLLPKEYTQMSVLTGVSRLFNIELTDDCFSAILDAQRSSCTLREYCYALELLCKHGQGFAGYLKAVNDICVELKVRRDKSSWTVEPCCHLLELISKYYMTFQWKSDHVAHIAAGLVFDIHNQSVGWHFEKNIKIFHALLGVCAATANKKVTELVLQIFNLNILMTKSIQARLYIPAPDERTGVCLLTAFASYKDTDCANRLVFGDGQRRSHLRNWGIEPGSDIYAYWTLVDADNFAQRIEELTDRNICHRNLGLTGNTLNCDCGSIFNNEIVRTSKGVPFEFAKALYEYHLNRNQSGDTINVVTGHDSGDKLKSQFVSYFREKGVNVRSNPAEPGMLLTGT